MSLLTDQERNAIEQMDNDQRFHFLLQQCQRSHCLWTLRSQEGGVLMSADDEDCMPIWPSEALAQLFAVGDWQDAEPYKIDLAAFRARWLPGLAKDGICLLLFPNLHDQALLLTANELAEEI